WRFLKYEKFLSKSLRYCFYKSTNNIDFKTFIAKITIDLIFFRTLKTKKMKKMYHYATVEKALRELEVKGYTIDYNVEEDRILKRAAEFIIEEIYRYEGMSNPDDEATVYGISNKINGDKGVFVAGNLSFAENDVAKILLKLEIDGKD